VAVNHWVGGSSPSRGEKYKIKIEWNRIMTQSLKEALIKESPLQIVGTINAYSALLAKQAGFRAIYLSGAGVANASYGLPDLGITTLNDVLEDIYRITYICDLPLLVDIDTGWGSSFNITRTIKSLIKAGASGAHIEDQASSKRCGHRPNKELVAAQEMCDRIKAAIDAKYDPKFTLMARTDALAKEGLEKTTERIEQYISAGAEMIFLEGVSELDTFRTIAAQFSSIPILANITEFGVTPLWKKAELASTGIKLILYPLSAFRAMSQAAVKIYNTIREEGTQVSLIANMQTRDQLYDVLHYHEYEAQQDKFLREEKKNGE
jgi:methylisocitrate lyase